MKKTETDLLHMMIERGPFDIPEIRIFRRSIINAPATVRGHTFRVRNGIIGQCDAYAIGRGGLHIEIETKAARGRLLKAQEAWQTFCHQWEIPYVILRAKTAETPDATVGRWIETLRAMWWVHEGKRAQ